MRNLTKKQKDLLLRTTDTTVTVSLYSALEELNDYETLIQDAERFLQDKQSQLITKRLNPDQYKPDWWKGWR